MPRRTRRDARTATIGPVTPPSSTRLTVELELGADPVAGVVHDDRGSAEPFCGWMELARAIELHLDAARRRSATPVAPAAPTPPPQES
jgi:hypothetical protein